MGHNLRIAIITNSFHPGIETFIWRHIRTLRTDVVAESRNVNVLEDGDWKPYIASLYQKKSSKESMARHMVHRLKEVCLGIPAPQWPKGMEEVWERYVRERRPDVALAEFAPNGMKAIEACQRHKIPLVVHFHGYDASSMLRIKSYSKCLPDLFKNSAAVVVVSRLMRKTLQDLGCPPSKLHVIPCGAPVTEFSVTDAVTRQPCLFLAVGRLIPMKNPIFTLRAFAQCASQYPDVTLTMIGTGKLYGKARKWIENTGLSKKVRLLGHQPIEIVRKYMAKSGVFVQHSVTTHIGHIEGCPVSIAEAASTGLPVIATNHGGIPDQVIDGATGFLVEEGDWKTMADRMVLLANNPELRMKMGLAGRRNIEQVGNFELQIRKLQSVLQKAAKFTE